MLHLHNYILIWIEKISQSQRLQLFEQPNNTLEKFNKKKYYFLILLL